MGKYLRMSKGAEEEVALAVMEVAEIGVKMKRAREVVDGEETDVVKRRKIGSVGEGELKPSSPAPSLLQLENNRGLVIPVNSVAPERLDHARASCCTFNQSSELSLENLEFVDLEEEGDGFATPKRNSECAESGKTPPFPAKLEPKVVPPKQLKFRLMISKSIPNNYPFAEEIEEFFAAEEQKRLKEFSDKYNFDFQNEKPMEGRYEWVKLLEERALKVDEDSADEIPVASSAMKVDEDSSGDEVSLASQ